MTGGVRRTVHKLRPGVLMLIRPGKRDGQDLAACPRFHHVNRRILHRQMATQVSVHPLHHGILISERSLGHQIENIVGPVLDGRVPAPSVLLHHHLDHGGVKTLGGVHRSRTTLDIMHLCAFIHNDKRSLELPHTLFVDSEVGLKGEIDFDPRWDVDERTARPNRRVQRGKFIVLRGNHRCEVLLDQLGILANRGVCVGEDHAHLDEILLQRTVHHFTFKLSFHPRKVFAFRLRNAKFVKGILDLLRHIFPRFALMIGRLQVVVDILKIEVDIPTPSRHRLGLENLERTQPELSHPIRFALDVRDLMNHVGGKALFGLEHALSFSPEIVLVDGANLIGRIIRWSHIRRHNNRFP